MNDQRSAGLTVVEVLVAVVILGVAIVGLVQLQGASLGYTRQAEHMRTVTQIAEAELQWIRQTEIHPERTSCETYVPSGYACGVETNILGFMGYDVTVNAWSPGADADNDEPDISLRAFTTGQRYITGIAPTDGFELEEPTEPPPDEEEPVVVPDPPPCTGGKGKGKGGGC